MSNIYTAATEDIKAPSDLKKIYFTPMHAPQDDVSVPVYLDREIRKIGEAIQSLAQDTISVDDIKLLISEGLASIIFPEGPDGEPGEFPFDYDELFKKIWDDIINNPLYEELFEEIVQIIVDPDNLNEFTDIIYDNFILNNRTFWQPTAPVSTDAYTLRENDIWINTSMGNVIFLWDGDSWEPADDVRIAEQGIAVQAILTMDNDLLNETAFWQSIENVTAYAGVTARVFYQNEEPPNPFPDPNLENGEYILKYGDQWYDTDHDVSGGVLGGEPAQYVHDGNVWVPATDQRIIGSWAAITEIGTVVANPTTAAAQQISQIRADVVTADFKAQSAITELNTTFTQGTSTMAESVRDLQSSLETDIGEVSASITDLETTKIGVCYVGGSPSDHKDKGTCVAAGGSWQEGIPFASAVKQVKVNDGDSTTTIEQKFVIQRTDINDAQLTADQAEYDAFLAQQAADSADGKADQAISDAEYIENGLLPPMQGNIDDILAQYTIKIDVNGKVAGFGLMNDGATSAFIVRADQFAIADQVTQNQVIPFAVVNNVVYIDTAVIRNLSIDNSKINTGQIGNMVFVNDAATYTVAKNSGNQYSQSCTSATFDGASLLTVSGWIISEDGDGLGGADGRITLAIQVGRGAGGISNWQDAYTAERTGIRVGGADGRYEMPFLFRYAYPRQELGSWNFVGCRLRMAGSTQNGATVKRVTMSATTTYKA